MCWACYTPLTATAGAAMNVGTGMGGAGAATMPRPGGPMNVPGADDGAAKKQIDPKLFFVGGGLLLAAIIALFTTGVLGGGAAPVVEIPQGVDPPGRTAFSTTGSSNPIPQTGTSIGLGSNGTSNTGSTQTTDTGPTFIPLTSPNPQYATATFAIASSQPGISVGAAEGLARKARQQMVTNGKWKNSQIAVFDTAESAQAFRQYVNQRRGAPLSAGDYQALGAGTWSKVPVFYETRAGSEKVSHPSQTPNGWW